MIDMCVEELGEILDGVLRLATMPPLAGGLEPVRRIVVDPNDVRLGDVFWLLNSNNQSQGWAAGQLQLAFMRGAAGAVTDIPGCEPWAGKFVLEVADSPAAMARLVRCLSLHSNPSVHLFGGVAALSGVAKLLRQEHLSNKEIVEAFGQPVGPIPA